MFSVHVLYGWFAVCIPSGCNKLSPSHSNIKMKINNPLINTQSHFLSLPLSLLKPLRWQVVITLVIEIRPSPHWDRRTIQPNHINNMTNSDIAPICELCTSVLYSSFFLFALYLPKEGAMYLLCQQFIEKAAYNECLWMLNPPPLHIHTHSKFADS